MLELNKRIEFDDIKKLSYEKLLDYYDKLPHNKEDDSIITRSTALYNIISYYINNDFEVYMSGIVEIMNNYGFLRDLTTNFFRGNSGMGYAPCVPFSATVLAYLSP